MASLICLQCKAGFHCKPSRVAKGRGKFCSRDCRTAHTGGLTRKYPVEYTLYCGAKARCSGTHKAKRARYQLRGIEFRFKSFAEFMDALGPRPDGMQVDRIDNNGHYEPNNVRWATAAEQTNNREVTVMLSHEGQTLPLATWAKIKGIRQEALYARIKKYGWSVAAALDAPHYTRSASFDK